MVDAPIFYARIGREYTECAQWREAALQKVQALKPDLFIFSSAPAAFTQQQWTEGTARVLARLSPAATRIVLLADTPALPFDGPQCLMQQALRPAWLADARRCNSARGKPMPTPYNARCKPPHRDSPTSSSWTWVRMSAPMASAARSWTDG